MTNETTQPASPAENTSPAVRYLCLPVVAASCCSDGGAECCSGDEPSDRADADPKRRQICVPVAVGCCADTACC